MTALPSLPSFLPPTLPSLPPSSHQSPPRTFCLSSLANMSALPFPPSLHQSPPRAFKIARNAWRPQATGQRESTRGRAESLLDHLRETLSEIPQSRPQLLRVSCRWFPCAAVALFLRCGAVAGCGGPAGPPCFAFRPLNGLLRPWGSRQVVVDLREFRSALPSLLHQRGMTLHPRTLEVLQDLMLIKESFVK